MSTNTRPLVFTVTQAGLLLGVSRSTAYEIVRTGELKSIRLRRRCSLPSPPAPSPSASGSRS